MIIYLGIGSNLGDRFKILTEVTSQFASQGLLRKQSAVYETLPIGGPEQPNYLNAALLLESDKTPSEFLEWALKLEAEFGRVRSPEQRNFPRPVDLDILLLGPRGETIIQTPSLEVPHPRLHLRTFALKPLLDLEETLVHPIFHLPLIKMYQAFLTTEPAPLQFADRLIAF